MEWLGIDKWIAAYEAAIAAYRAAGNDEDREKALVKFRELGCSEGDALYAVHRFKVK